MVKMLSGLSSLFFGNGGTDDAAVDQTLASQSMPLDTVSADNGWVLVDVADSEGKFETGFQSFEESVNHLEAHRPDRKTEHEEQVENQPSRGSMGNAVQQRNAHRAPQVVRGNSLEIQQIKLTRSMQRQQSLGKTKQLTRRHLEISNKTRMVKSCGQKPTSAGRRVLRPSGQMNGRRSQRNF
ncbi:uncharacterized protein LOC143300744 isoform X2 [Babylonia areolata]|uniref:uncharacterized protein LOC143300744 isoform X2 n=1 Tax=Babylonia areolata TaxID=304850 RepID=UPI003FCF7E41